MLRDPDAVAPHFMGAEVLIHPRMVLRAVSGGLALDHYYHFKSEPELVSLGMILLLDPRRISSWPRLCQCQLPACGTFFFEKRPPTGRPQRKYCSRAHMLRAHDENASARMAKRRPAKPK
jgi:hypothetical protein